MDGKQQICGRWKFRIAAEQMPQIVARRQAGESYRAIGRSLGCDGKSVRRAIVAYQERAEWTIEDYESALTNGLRLVEVRAQGQPEAAPRQPWWRRAVDQLREAWETLRAFVAGGIR